MQWHRKVKKKNLKVIKNFRRKYTVKSLINNQEFRLQQSAGPYFTLKNSKAIINFYVVTNLQRSCQFSNPSVFYSRVTVVNRIMFKICDISSQIEILLPNTRFRTKLILMSGVIWTMSHACYAISGIEPLFPRHFLYLSGKFWINFVVNNLGHNITF